MTLQAVAQVEEGSKTEGKTDWLLTSTVDTTSYRADFKDLNWYLAGRVLYQPVGFSTLCQALSRPESAEPTKLLMTIFIGGENEKYLIHSFKNHWQVAKHTLGRADEWSWQGFEKTVAIGPADDAWTVPTWVDISKCEVLPETELAVLKKEIRALLNDFRAGKPLDRPQELRELAAKIADQSRQPDEQSIESWAEELAEKLSKLTD
jgi:hypothetical protein